jgi:two-component system alkaline phosphatase synthesis response regulator PhoP
MKKKICIVEDDENIREIYSTKLRHSGYDIVTAINGAEGLDVIDKTRPDLILLDLQMPVKNGFEVMESLKQNVELSKIPIIILTNADDDQSSLRAGKFETRFYIVKALTTPQKLLGYIREVLH